ncbi:MAG: dephospho-CoA kinase [Actinomycetota bacterium]
MLVAGLTGGIGSGKSTISSVFAALGAVVISADKIAREVLEVGTLGLQQIVEVFGSEVLTADGSLNRTQLASLVFNDPQQRAALERVTHPLIAARTAQLMSKAPADAVVIHDVPLLVEKNLGPRYHVVVVVAAPESIRYERLVQNRGMSPEDAWSRIHAQANDADRAKAADFWLDSNRPFTDTRREVELLWAHRLYPFAQHLYHGTFPAVQEIAAAQGLATSGLVSSAQESAQRAVQRLRYFIQETPQIPTHKLRLFETGSHIQILVHTVGAIQALREPLYRAGFMSETVSSGEPCSRYRCPDPGNSLSVQITIAKDDGELD